MWQTLNDRIARLNSGQFVTRDDVVWWALVIGLVFASIHLLTMLVTRWGDRKISIKSLVASILVHMTCGLGVVVMEPLPPVGDSEGNGEETQFEQQVSIESDIDGNEDDGEGLPFWEEPVSENRNQTRLELLNASPSQPEEAVRSDLESTAPVNVEPELTAQVPDSLPDLVQNGDPKLAATADTAVQIDDDLPFDTVLNADTIPRSRLDPLRPGQILDKIERDEPQRGSVDRQQDDLSVEATFGSLNAEMDPDGELPQQAVADTYETRAGPATSDLPIEEFGGVSGDDTGLDINSARLNPRRQRIDTRVRDSSPDGQSMAVARDPASDSALVRQSAAAPVISSLVGDIQEGPQPNAISEDAFSVLDRKRGTVAPIYQLRDLANRKKNAIRYGGSEASELAVENSLKWLAGTQNSSGFWDASEYGSGQVKLDENNVDRMNAGINADTGITALATLAFLGAGNTHEKGPYTRNVDRALNWLIDQQGSDGNLYGDASHFARMYCHGMSTYALAEAYGMQSDPTAHPRIRYALRRAIEYIIQRQNTRDGGWRYRISQQGDMSMFGWQLMALKSAEIAGLEISSEVKSRMAGFLKTRSLGNRGGLAAYRPGEKITAAMTAESLFCKQMLGIARDDPASKEAVSFLLRYRPTRTDYNLYYWYYGMLAMRHYGGLPFDVWNDTIQNLLVTDQVRSGPLAGSWDNDTLWGAYGGRVYTTALSTLCLEVYYRQLPLYRTSPEVKSDENR